MNPVRLCLFYTYVLLSKKDIPFEEVTIRIKGEIK